MAFVIGVKRLKDLIIDTAKNWLGYGIKNVGSPVDATDAARKAEVDAKVSKVGDLMTGGLSWRPAGNIMYHRSITGFYVPANTTGAIVIDTNIPIPSQPISILIEGYRDTGSSLGAQPFLLVVSTIVDVESNFVRPGYINLGPLRPRVRLARNITTNKIALILGDTTSVLDYFYFHVSLIEHTGDESHRSGWSINVRTDLTRYDKLTDVPDAGPFLINAGSTPSIQAGPDASKPAAGTAGRLYLATDTHILYQDDSTAWVKMATVDWDDIDGKPTSFTPSAHKASHESGGSDAITNLASGAKVADYTIWHAGNDGAESGLDADKLDAKHWVTVASGSATIPAGSTARINLCSGGAHHHYLVSVYSNGAVYQHTPSYAGFMSWCIHQGVAASYDRLVLVNDGSTSNTMYYSVLVWE